MTNKDQQFLGDQKQLLQQELVRREQRVQYTDQVWEKYSKQQRDRDYLLGRNKFLKEPLPEEFDVKFPDVRLLVKEAKNEHVRAVKECRNAEYQLNEINKLLEKVDMPQPSMSRAI